MQDAAYFWEQFTKTGEPEAYLAYRNALDRPEAKG